MRNTDKKYHYLYKTTNLINDKYYYGIHSTNNLNDGYLGSGKYLRNSIHRHGKDNFKCVIIKQFNNREELLEAEAKLITREMLENKQCMNLCFGGYGGATGMVSVKDQDGKYLSVFNDDPRYLSGELVGCTKGFVNVKDKNGNTLQVSIKDSRYLSGELVCVNTGTITVKDQDDNYFKVSIDDPRYLNGELVPTITNMIIVKNQEGNTFQVSIKDPRYLSSELVVIWTNKKHTKETRKKISESKKGTGIGKDNSMYGKKQSEEMKQKIRDKLSTKFYVYDLDDNFISEECGIKQYADKHDLNPSSIVKVLKGKYKQTGKLKFYYNKI